MSSITHWTVSVQGKRFSTNSTSKHLIDLAIIRWLVVIIHLIHVLHVLFIFRVFLTVLLILVILLLFFFISSCLRTVKASELNGGEWNLKCMRILSGRLHQHVTSKIGFPMGIRLLSFSAMLCSWGRDSVHILNHGHGQSNKETVSRQRRLPRFGAVAPAGSARSRPRRVGPSWTTETPLSGGRERGTAWTCLSHGGDNNKQPASLCGVWFGARGSFTQTKL